MQQYPSYSSLVSLQAEWRQRHLRDAFAGDVQRAQRFSLSAAQLTLDYSKNHIDDAVMQALCKLANEAGLSDAMSAMRRGDAINNTEQRAVLHSCLRMPPAAEFGPPECREAVQACLARMRDFVEQVHGRQFTGSTAKPIRHVVNIGIGGSDLGPRMVCQALAPYRLSHCDVHFVSNIDASELMPVLQACDPEATLVIVASKSFSTLETRVNAESARAWLLAQGIAESALHHHLVAVSANAKAAVEFGVAENNVFPMWDWVGGRFSLWSAIGLPIALSVGFQRFDALLQGAADMDAHFFSAPYEANMPVILALIDIWYQNFWGTRSRAVIPYLQDLARLPAYLQQLCMESNGKGVRSSGEPVDIDTGHVIWGEPGTNGQHSFHQLLHQGTEHIPVDFILALRSAYPVGDHHAHLVANCISQSKALMDGRSVDDIRMAAGGQLSAEEELLLAHKMIPGNRASHTLMMPELTPESLGALLALYEHRVFVQSVIWQINAFDQWGVEIGKLLGKQVFAVMSEGAAGQMASVGDASSDLIVQRYLQAQADK